MSDDVPAGWYPTPDGKQRYWNGAKWTSLPPVPDDPQQDHVESTTTGRSIAPSPTKKRRRVLVFAAIGLVVLLVTAAVSWKLIADGQAEEAKALAADVAAADAAAQQKRLADVRLQAEDDERELRQESVESIEVSIKTMAEGHAAEGVIDGPIIDVSCSPINGGSTDDLTEQTTVFDCFVANVDNGDGTMNGYYYNSTMNWSTGEYTYGMGRG